MLLISSRTTAGSKYQINGSITRPMKAVNTSSTATLLSLKNRWTRYLSRWTEIAHSTGPENAKKSQDIDLLRVRTLLRNHSWSQSKSLARIFQASEDTQQDRSRWPVIRRVLDRAGVLIYMMIILMMIGSALHQARQTRSANGPPRSDRPYTIHFGRDVAPVRRTLGSLTRRVNQICMAMAADSVAGSDLTPVEYGAMACLNKQDGEPGIDQIGLAARLGVDRNSVSLLVNELAAKG